MRRLLCLLFVCGGFAIFLIQPEFIAAQLNRASVTGTVTDPSGAIIVGAQVAARNDDTGVETSTVSNDRGIYLVPNLAPGNYSLKVTKDGFKPVEFLHVGLILDQVAKLNASLSPGATMETVTVTSGAPVLETETSTIGTNMNGDVVSDLPLNVYGGRQAEYFAVALTPGYSPLSDPYLAIINGNQGFTKDFTIDGTSGTAQIQGDIFESGPSMEAVEELQAETSGLSARNGITNGGVVMLGLKSGTNQFHGSVFGYGHNELLDANTFDNDHLKALCLNGDTLTAPPPCAAYNKTKSRFWDWGFSAGGPIIKNKTFIFGTFERYQQHDFTPGGFGSAATVPTPAFLSGNFSTLLNLSNQLGTDKYGNPVYQGALFNPADPGAVFVGNVIPSSMFSSVSNQILAIYQKGYVPELPTEVQNDRLPASNSPAQTPNEIDIKVDHNLTQNDRLSGSWMYNHRPRTLVDSGGVWQPGSTDGGPLADARLQMVKANEFRVTESHTFSPTLLNTFNATYNWYWNGSSPTITTNFPQQLGFGSTGATNFPAINFGPAAWNGDSETGIGNTWQGFYVGATYIYGDEITWVKGRNNFTFGGDFRAMQINSHSGSGVLSMNFRPNFTAAPNGTFSGNTGFGFADFLLGDVTNASESTPYNLYGRRKAMSFYVQDNFKATHKLTLNLGLRWDMNFRFHEKYGHWANFDLNAIDPNLGIKGAIVYAKNGSDSFETNQDFKNFAPQIGFAYNPWERVVFRGSFGLLYVPIGIQYWEGVPYAFDPGERGTNAAPGTFNWDAGYPGVFTPGTTSSTPLLTQFPVVNVDPNSLRAPYSTNFNVGVQFELTKTSRIEASYIGNRGHRLQDSNLAYDQPNPGPFFKLFNSDPLHQNFQGYVCSAADATAVSQASGVNVPYPYSGFCAPAFAALAPYPQIQSDWANYWFYPTLYYVGLGKGQSYYDSMVIHYVRRFDRGLFADVSYTLSRQEWNTYTNFGENYDIGFNSIQNYNNLGEAAHTLSPYDQTHVIKAGISYELPLGHGHTLLGSSNHVVNAIVHGWRINPLLTYATGKPLTFYSTDVYDFYYGDPVWPAIYDNYDLSGYHGRQFSPGRYVFPTSANATPAQNRYFPASVATNPPDGQLGSGPARISALRGFGTDREDIAVHKTFSMGSEGRYTLDCGVEFYNVLNRHAFADPNTGSPGSSNFGLVLGDIGTPRNGQFEARFRW